MPAPKDVGARTRMGKRMRQIRQYRELTGKQVGDLIGVREQAVYGWERGKWSPTNSALNRLLSALECSHADLMEPLNAPLPPRRPKLKREDPEESC